MYDLNYLLSVLAFSAPPVIILVVGLALIMGARGRLAPRVRTMGALGCGLMLLGPVLSTSFQFLLPAVTDTWGWGGSQGIFLVYGLLFVTIECAGLALLVGAILAARSPAASAPPPMAVAKQG